jgi:hypothetical protein
MIDFTYVTCAAKETGYPLSTGWGGATRVRQVWLQGKRDNSGYLMIAAASGSHLAGIELQAPVADTEMAVLHIDGGPSNGLNLDEIYVFSEADSDVLNVLFEVF